MDSHVNTSGVVASGKKSSTLDRKLKKRTISSVNDDSDVESQGEEEEEEEDDEEKNVHSTFATTKQSHSHTPVKELAAGRRRNIKAGKRQKGKVSD